MPVFAVVTILVIPAILTFAPEAALAQGSDEWVKPATSLIDILRSGLVQLGVGAVGLFVIIRGFMMVMSTNPEWAKIGVVILGGMLIMAGPAAIATILEAIQS